MDTQPPHEQDAEAQLAQLRHRSAQEKRNKTWQSYVFRIEAGVHPVSGRHVLEPRDFLRLLMAKEQAERGLIPQEYKGDACAWIEALCPQMPSAPRTVANSTSDAETAGLDIAHYALELRHRDIPTQAQRYFQRTANRDVLGLIYCWEMFLYAADLDAQDITRACAKIDPLMTKKDVGRSIKLLAEAGAKKADALRIFHEKFDAVMDELKMPDEARPSAALLKFALGNVLNKDQRHARS